MKLILTRDEVTAIVLAHIKSTFPATDLNTCEIADYRTEYCVLTHKPPPLTAPEQESAA